jgi:DNA-binding PadR family transcriptional regulator
MRILYHLAAAGAGITGTDLGRRVERNSGTLYPDLTRLEQAGLIASVREDGAGRRRLYWITDAGRAEIGRAS